MWILLKEILRTNFLFEDSWKYKGDRKEAILKKRSHLIQELLKPPIIKNEIDVENIHITSDDELDAFVCWLMATLLIKKDKSVKIYGDSLNGSFLLSYDEEIYKKLDSYLIA